MKSNKIDHTLAVDFILGGNSLFTLLNVESGNRFTFKVKKHKLDDVYFVSVLTNPDMFEFIGSIKSNVFRHSKKSRIYNTSQSVRVFDFVLSKLNTGTLSPLIEIWHQGRCGKCGRVLTVPSSIESGFGPECSKNRSK